MKIVVYNASHLGVLHDGAIVDFTDLVPPDVAEWPRTFGVRAIAAFDRLRPEIERRVASGPRIPLASVALEPPVVCPSKIVAAPVNYRAHIQEAEHWEWMKGRVRSIEQDGVFLKAPSSIVGPNATVEIPFEDRRVDHEVELAFVIGRTARSVRASEAMQYVFGYTCAMDITVRGTEDRSTRKSFDTFTPVGPWIVTRDEVPDPHSLRLTLTVNGEPRQDANTRDLIWDIPKLIAYASDVMTLHPGDLFITGTPEGVGPIVPGDRVTATVEKVAELSVMVCARKR